MFSLEEKAMDKNLAVEWILETMFDYSVSDNVEIVEIFMKMTEEELLEFMHANWPHDLDILRKEDLERLKTILVKYNCQELIGVEDEGIGDGFSQLN